jgi:hypothetical protein
MVTIAVIASHSGELFFPRGIADGTSVTATPDAPTTKPTTPDIQPAPDINPVVPDEPAGPPTFVPPEDPDTCPARTRPEGSPDEGDDDFETCYLPGSFRASDLASKVS